MTSTGFNLATDRWIPVAGSKASIEEALTDAHMLPGWPDGDPGLAEALLRLLVPIIYRVAGLDDETLTRSGFATRQQRLLDNGRFDPDEVRQYLNRHKDRFWIVDPPLGEVPFGQDPALAAVDPHEAAKAVSRWASGNGPVLGPHAPCGVIAPDEAVCHLMVQRCYSLHGIHTPHPGTTKARASLLAGPLRGTMSVHPVGATLAATLIAHLVPLPSDGTRFGEPFWETTQTAGPVERWSERAGLLEQIAVRQDKTMLLRITEGAVTGFTLAEGRGVSADLSCRDPYLLTNPDGTPSKPSAGKALWRECEALITQTDRGVRARTAEILDWAIFDEADTCYRNAAFSWAVVSHRGAKNAQDLEWTTSTFPDLLRLFAPEAKRRAEQFMALAKEADQTMRNQVVAVWKRIKDRKQADEKMWEAASLASTEFWRLAEHDFWATMTGDPPLDHSMYTDRLRRHALAGYHAATERLTHDRRAHLAVEESRKWLVVWQRRSGPPPSDKETSRS